MSNLLLSLILAFYPAILIPQGVIYQPGASSLVNKVCTASGNSHPFTCTGAHGVALGDIALIYVYNAGSFSPSASDVSDSSNTYSTLNQCFDSVSGLQVNAYYSAVTTANTTSTVYSTSVGGTMAVYDVTGVSTVDVQSATGGGCIQGFTTSYSTVTSANATASKQCIAGLATGGGNTITVGTGYAFLDNITDSDNKTLYTGWKTGTSGGTVTATATLASSAQGAFAIACFK